MGKNIWNRGEAEKNVGTVQFISNKTPAVQLNSEQGIWIDLSSKKTPEWRAGNLKSARSPDGEINAQPDHKGTSLPSCHSPAVISFKRQELRVGSLNPADSDADDAALEGNAEDL